MAGKIAGQAQRSGIAIPDAERKMLYFSGTNWTLPDIAGVNAAFEREYPRVRYEKKAVKIVGQLRARERGENAGDFDLWNEAIETLREGGHYPLVMAGQAGAAGLTSSAVLLAGAIVLSMELSPGETAWRGGDARDGSRQKAGRGRPARTRGSAPVCPAWAESRWMKRANRSR